jgi:quercetin dioxygenase-like cupin family protein
MKKCLFAVGLFSLLVPGCKTPEVNLPEIPKMFYRPKVDPQLFMKNVDEMVKLAPLPKDKDFLVTNFGQNEYQTINVVQARKMPAHYHSFHHETVYVKSGQGTLRIDERDYEVKPGLLMHIPKGAIHSFASSSDEPAVVISIVSPPSDGKDFVDITVPPKPK